MTTASGGGDRRLPSFLVIGAMKAGSTSLHNYLAGQPGVFMSGLKEPDFFCRPDSWSRGLDWYAGLFADAPPDAVCGEASVSYTKFPMFTGVPDRIASVLPDVRLIYLMRHPVERMVSEWRHVREIGTETKPLREAVIQHSRYLLHSSYYLQAEQYLRVFDRERLLMLTFEDLVRDPVTVVRRAMEHVGADPDGVSSQRLAELSVVYNPSAGKTATRIPSKVVHAKWLAARTRLPAPVVQVADRVVTRRLRDDELVLDDRTRKAMTDLVRPDVVRLRELMPAGFDGWGIG